MNTPEIVIIAAMDSKRGIGKDGKIPWRIPEDMKLFKEQTVGHPIIMGWKTWDSLGKPLPDRTNIVITHKEDFRPEGAAVAHSLDEAIEKAAEVDPRKIFIIGGGQIYQQALHLADSFFLTTVEGDFGCDAFFPDYEGRFNRVIAQSEGESKGYKYQFLNLAK